MAKEYTTRTLREIVRVVASRFVGIVVIFAILVGSVALATVLSPKWYRSETQILVNPGRMLELLENPATFRDRVSLFIITQREILTSDYVVATALMRLDGRAAQAGSEAPAVPWYPAKDVDDYAHSHGEYLRKVLKRIRLVVPGGPETTFTQVTTVTVDWPEERPLARSLGKDPRKLAVERAFQMAKYLVEAYLKRHAQLESEQTKARTDFLTEDRMKNAQTDLDQARADLTEFIQKYVKGDLPLLVAMSANGSGTESGTATLSTQFRAEINKIDADLADLKVLKQAVDSQLASTDPNAIRQEVRKEMPNAEAAAIDKALQERFERRMAAVVVPDAVTAGNPIISLLQNKILQLRMQINSLQPRFTDDYRELKDARAELASALSDLRGELDKRSRGLGQQIDSLTARQQILTAKVADDRKDVDDLAAKAAKYQELQRKVDIAESLFKEVRNQVLNAQTAEKLAGRKDSFVVTMLDQPTLPEISDPRRPILWLNLLIAVVAGLVVGLVYAFLADHFDHTMKGIDEAERYLGTPVLASLPKLGRNIIVIE